MIDTIAIFNYFRSDENVWAYLFGKKRKKKKKGEHIYDWFGNKITVYEGNLPRLCTND